MLVLIYAPGGTSKPSQHVHWQYSTVKKKHLPGEFICLTQLGSLSQFWHFVTSLIVFQSAFYFALNFSKNGFLFLHLSQAYWVVVNTTSMAYLHLTSSGSPIKYGVYLLLSWMIFNQISLGNTVSPPGILAGVAALMAAFTLVLGGYLKVVELYQQLDLQVGLTKFVLQQHLQPNTATTIAMDSSDGIGPYLCKSLGLSGCWRKSFQQQCILGRYPMGLEEVFLGEFDAYFQKRKAANALEVLVLEASSVKPSSNLGVLSQASPIPLQSLLDGLGLQNASELHTQVGRIPTFGLSGFSGQISRSKANTKKLQAVLSVGNQERKSLSLTIDSSSSTFFLKVDEIESAPHYLDMSSTSIAGSKRKSTIQSEGGGSSNGSDRGLLQNRYNFSKMDHEALSADQLGVDKQNVSFSDKVEHEVHKNIFAQGSSSESGEPSRKLAPSGHLAQYTVAKKWHEKLDTFEVIQEEEESGELPKHEDISLQKQDTAKRRSAFAERASKTLDERRAEIQSIDTLAPPSCEDDAKILDPESNFEVDFQNSSEESAPKTSSRRPPEEEQKESKTPRTPESKMASQANSPEPGTASKQFWTPDQDDLIQGGEEAFLVAFGKDLDSLQFIEPQLARFDSKQAQNNPSSQNDDAERFSRGRNNSLSQMSQQLNLNKSLKSMGDEFNSSIRKKEPAKVIRLFQCQPKHSSQKSLDQVKNKLGSQSETFSQLLSKSAKIMRTNTNSQKRLFGATHDNDKESQPSGLDHLPGRKDTFSQAYYGQQISSPNVHSQLIVNEGLLEKKIETLQCQVNTNRIFLNMVIHDMRNPTNSIEYGVKKTLDLFTKFKASAAHPTRADFEEKIELIASRLVSPISSYILSKLHLSGPEEQNSPSMIPNEDPSPIQRVLRQPSEVDLPPTDEWDDNEDDSLASRLHHSVDISDKNVSVINPRHNLREIHQGGGQVVEIQKVIDRVVFTAAHSTAPSTDQAVQVSPGDLAVPLASRGRLASISISSLDEEPIHPTSLRLPKEATSVLADVQAVVRKLVGHEVQVEFKDMLDLVSSLGNIWKTEQILQHSIFSASMLNNLINDLLDLAKFESNSFNFNEEYFNLVQTIDNAFNQVRFIANQKKIILKSTLKNIHAITSRNEVHRPFVKINNPEVADDPLNTTSLLETSSKVMGSQQLEHEKLSTQFQKEMKLLENVRGDSRRYMQIIMNFLSNALKFTSSEGTITVKLSLIEVQRKKEKEPRKKRGRSKNDPSRSHTMRSYGRANPKLSHTSLMKDKSFDLKNGYQDLLRGGENRDSQFSEDDKSCEGRPDKMLGAGFASVSSMSAVQDPPEDQQNSASRGRSKSIGLERSQEQLKQPVQEEGGVSFIRIRIDVCDTGVGIKKENLSKLFMDFGRLDEHSKMNAQGTGLGLSICKRMVEQMGGTVSVDSALGEGTTFTVEMQTKAKAPDVSAEPLLNSESLKKTPRARKVPNNSPTGRLETIIENSIGGSSQLASDSARPKEGQRDSTTSLVTLSHPLLQAQLYPNQIEEIDEHSSSSEDHACDLFQAVVANDEDFQLMIVSNTLEQAGFAVLKEACNGHEAYEFMLQSKKRKVIDLVLLDLNMPIMNGFDACRQIKSLFSNKNKLFALDRAPEVGDDSLGDSRAKSSKMKNSFTQPQSPMTPKRIISLLDDEEAMPLFVAFSAHVDASVEKEASQAGFDLVIDAPLSLQKIQECIVPQLESRRWRRAQIAESQMGGQSPSRHQQPGLNFSKKVIDFSQASESQESEIRVMGAAPQYLQPPEAAFEEIKEATESNELSSCRQSLARSQGLSRLSIRSPCFGLSESMKQNFVLPPGALKSEIKDVMSMSDGDDKIFIMSSSLGSFKLD